MGQAEVSRAEGVLLFADHCLTCLLLADLVILILPQPHDGAVAASEDSLQGVEANLVQSVPGDVQAAREVVTNAVWRLHLVNDILVADPIKPDSEDLLHRAHDLGTNRFAPHVHVYVQTSAQRCLCTKVRNGLEDVCCGFDTGHANDGRGDDLEGHALVLQGVGSLLGQDCPDARVDLHLPFVHIFHDSLGLGPQALLELFARAHARQA
mmetsp:Transcript_43791/g.111447  ORF Transcript_43791/g.111447 Transcript_43791/m.111447 type:complete len:209 (+) Transcript_43791:345-971(+)